jgi:hypothetical protein
MRPFLPPAMRGTAALVGHLARYQAPWHIPGLTLRPARSRARLPPAHPPKSALTTGHHPVGSWSATNSDRRSSRWVSYTSRAVTRLQAHFTVLAATGGGALQQLVGYDGSICLSLAAPQAAKIELYPDRGTFLPSSSICNNACLPARLQYPCLSRSSTKCQCMQASAMQNACR